MKALLIEKNRAIIFPTTGKAKLYQMNNPYLGCRFLISPNDVKNILREYKNLKLVNWYDAIDRILPDINKELKTRLYLLCSQNKLSKNYKLQKDEEFKMLYF